MTGPSLLELELIAAGESDPDLQEACIEIRRCHVRIDELLETEPQGIDRQRADELRKLATESCKGLEEATARILRLVGEGVAA